MILQVEGFLARLVLFRTQCQEPRGGRSLSQGAYRVGRVGSSKNRSTIKTGGRGRQQQNRTDLSVQDTAWRYISVDYEMSAEVLAGALWADLALEQAEKPLMGST